MMLCFVCLIENRDTPTKAVTHVQGTAVCREHLTAFGASDLMSLSHKLRGVGEKLREKQNHQQQLVSNEEPENS